MDGVILSFTNGKKAEAAVLRTSLSIELMLVPLNGAPKLDEAMHPPVMDYIVGWMQRQFVGVGVQGIFPTNVAHILRQIVNGLPIAGIIEDVTAAQVRRLDDGGWPKEVHWYFDAAGLLSLGGWAGGKPVPGLTYEPMAEGYYVMMPSYEGDMKLIRLVG